MADISHLGPRNDVNLDLGDTYAVNQKKTFQLPPKGKYTVQAPDGFAAEAFTRTKKGALQIDISPKIVGGPFDGFGLRRQRVSTTPFERNGQTVSMVGDYLIANGIRQTLADEQEVANAVESTSNRTYEVELDWLAEDWASGFKVKGMQNFPKLADGSYQSWVNHPTEIDSETGNPKRVRAYLNIVRFYPAS